ncbi:CHAD domain-containing protein [Gloeocapsa sp. PCC 73106]|uniref:CHAD domain-containing protein n=1 Tax=Gloeocapsa sp. PCC 73106 TaxID=102232 RepID=UPI0002AC7C81|nr:CHAD domain-containing protein [Gloeocapsa sp. PCC 73106]ELR98004.1 hypothetical protein GLO73106DRAFT_00018240 [Gloeocapsa sp. PCC 73106]
MTQLLATEAKSFGNWGYLAVDKHFQKIIKHEEAVFRDEDPEELHQMRVGVRRLRSAIAAFAPAIKLPKTAQDQNLGKIGRTLGVLRDLDVLAEAIATQYLPYLPETEQQVLDQGLKFLQKRRHKALKRVQKMIQEDLYQDFKQGLQGWLAQPSYQKLAEIGIQLILPDLLLPEISRLLLHPAWLVGVKIEDTQLNFAENRAQVFYLEAEVLHDLRKEAKRVRYLLELFTQFYGEDYQHYLEDIKNIQGVLGEIQDSFILGEFLTGALKSNWRVEMPTLLSKIQDSREQKYHAWGELQQSFLQPELRKSLHLTLTQPQSE